MFQVQFEDKRYGVEFRHAVDYEHEHGRGMTTCEIKVLGTIYGVIAQAFCSSSDIWRYSKGEKESLRKALEYLGATREEREIFWSEYFLVHDRLRQSRKEQKAECEQVRKDAVALEKLKRYCAKHNAYFRLIYEATGIVVLDLSYPYSVGYYGHHIVNGELISEVAEKALQSVGDMMAVGKLGG